MFAIDPSSDPCRDSRRRVAALDALRDAVDWAYGGVSMPRSRHRSRFANTGPRVGLCEVLADAIVQVLIAADGADRHHIDATMLDGTARPTSSRKLPVSHDLINKHARQ
jgi:hypothetical protein